MYYAYFMYYIYFERSCGRLSDSFFCFFCVTQQTCLLCHTADMSAVTHSRHVCCVTPQTCLLCHMADMSSAVSRSWMFLKVITFFRLPRTAKL